MDLLREYAASSDGAQSDSEDERMRAPISFDSCKSLAIPKTGLDVAPAVVTRHDIGGTACVDPRTKELDYNPKYEELFQPIAGPSNPFKSSSQSAHKNMLTGYVETAHVDSFQFDQQIRAFDTLGYARDPSADQSNKYIGDVQRAKEKQGASLVEGEKTGGEKRKRVRNMDASDVNGYTGPWARFEDEELVSKPEGELAKEMEEIVRKRQKNSRAGRRAAEQQQQGNFDEASTLHLKEPEDYQGRSFMHAPQYIGVNLREEHVPERCFIPKKQIHIYRGHNKGINCIRWFPKSAHLFLSASMDSKIKLWEVYGKRSVVRTYAGHKMSVKDVTFNNDGTEFLSASFDRFIKLWDTETGEVKQRFHTGHIPFCVRFNPDEDKQNMFLSGMQNKKILQWDTRTGEIVQEYDRHLGIVNSITFFDKNRRFCSTSDDKSIRIWEWEIPVDTKLIQNAGLHSIPTMTKSPTEKWIVGQSMDNRIVLFQLIDDKLRFAKKKAFKGHNVAGYACSVDFSPDMSFLTSGDADGKVFIWDWRNHKIVARWKAHDECVISTLWHPHETSRIVTGSWDSQIKMWA
ncbi:Pre-mRNA-processing factor 17 [Toxocara canis]|uniref:Pre-mRNA-processing factor 17 n=1 Tax=Toxocara canis TaxID=6265 RepID=A0A0B2VEE1_TOXCA|nr:Pre-mRNA-processing factor 17 [Toxocara canis]